jgi:hypothetical protein
MGADTEPGAVARTAVCGCGALRVTVTGTPLQVHACSCLQCQRGSGGAFTYTVWFPNSAVATIEGEHHSWRRAGSSGTWVESSFCPTCGARVFGRVAAWPEVVGISVGCFADPAFEPPAKLYWASRRHHWLLLPRGVAAIDTQ